MVAAIFSRFLISLYHAPRMIIRLKEQGLVSIESLEKEAQLRLAEA